MLSHSSAVWYHEKRMLPSRAGYSTRKAWEDACWKSLLKRPAAIDVLTTGHERRIIVLRSAIQEGLAVGNSYRKIGEELWASPQTISTIKKSFRKETYRSYFQRSKTERKKRVYSSLPKEPRAKYAKPIYKNRPRTYFGTEMVS